MFSGNKRSIDFTFYTYESERGFANGVDIQKNCAFDKIGKYFTDGERIAVELMRDIIKEVEALVEKSQLSISSELIKLIHAAFSSSYLLKFSFSQILGLGILRVFLF